MSRFRHAFQFAFTALTNGYAAGFLKGKIYTGDLKKFCVPGLSCYSCPGALGSCPIGALQAVIAGRNYDVPFYVLGFLVMVGAVCGRFVCGWLCPLGLLQDLLYKIPFVNKIKKLPGDRWLRYLRYIVLALFVVLLPLMVTDIIGQGKPWFCQYICPSGTFMAGIPLALTNPGIRSAVGWLFSWKVLLLIMFVVLSVVSYRPFCRYICPLGAIYGPFNKFALYRFAVDQTKCTNCGACTKACKLNIDVLNNPNSVECIRCGDCRRACPTRAIDTTLGKADKKPPRKS